MYPNFESLSEEKRRDIIDVCIKEFAQKNYEKASTNTIVKKAGISKGILFHYFQNKKNLYLYIVDQIMDEFQAKFYTYAIDKSSDDVFDKLISWGMLKLRMFYEEPLKYGLIINAFLNTHADLKEDIAQRYDKLFGNSMANFMEGIDTSKFRKGIDNGKAIELVVLSLEAIGNKYMKIYDEDVKAGLENIEKILDEFKEYMEILKFGIYNNSES